MEPITNENIRDLVKRYLKRNSGLPEINSWDVSNVTDMTTLFRDAIDFNEPLDNWNVSNVTNMSFMFSNAKTFNQPLNGWNVSNVTDMRFMFNGALKFNQPLDRWNVSNVTNMANMFSNAKKFNQPLNGWNVSNVKYMNKMFFHANSFNQPLDRWTVSKVTNMIGMFMYAKTFNQPLNGWNVSNVTDMRFIFNGALKFNQPLDRWNVSNVTNMANMFSNAKTFNQPLNGWNVSNVKYMNDMFMGARNFDIRNLPEIFSTSSEFRTRNPYLFINNSSNTGESSVNLGTNLYNQLSSIPLTNSTETINLNNSGYDAITMEEIQFSEYLKQDIANILIQYNGNVYFANKNSIKALVLDGSAIKYGCKTVSTSIIPSRGNLYDEACFNMNSIGIISGLAYLSKIKTILETSELKVFEIPREPIMNYVSTASLRMLSSQPNAVSASHCQEGQSANVFDITVIPYESTGGKKTRKKTKKKTRKTKKTRKSKKKIRQTSRK